MAHVDRATDTTAATRRVEALTSADSAAGVIPRFRDVVLAQPRAVAAADGSGELTYADLAAQAAGVLAAVREALAGLGPATGPEAATGSAGVAEQPGGPEPVGVLCGHGTAAVAAILAVLASGHPVLVLDARTPVPRLRQFVERSGVRLVVADPANAEAAGLLARRVAVPAPDVRADAATLWAAPPDPASPAALAFTSGSTGVPKLVVNDHRLLARDAWNSSVATGCYGADDVLAHTLPMAFHAGLTTTVHGLLAGATMRLYDARATGIGALPAWISANRATVMITSPALLRAFVAADPDPGLLVTLRTVTVAGEALYGGDVEAVRPLLPPACVVRHRYGSSETGLIAEYAIGPDHPPVTGAVPVGRGVGETRVGLDGGVVTVTAPSVALGYWNDPAATAAAFTDNPDGTRTYRTSDVGQLRPDGNLLLVGRADHSVKIRGYLVDPAEIDAVLFGLPEVREAVVTGRPRTGGGLRLVAYVAAASAGLTAAPVRARLRAVLPSHMVPEAVVFLDALPRTDRGKIDRTLLPEPPEHRTAPGEELSSWEELVAGVWADVLERDHVALDDDFFELGGDSLAVEALLTRLTTDLDVSPDVATTSLLVAEPALRGFAARLLEAASHRSGPLVPLQPSGRRPPLFLVAGGGGLGVAFVPWARRLGPEQPVWALQSPALEGRGLPDRSVTSLARRYVAAIRGVQSRGPYHLAGHSFGGLVAFEMAHQLRAAGHEVALLGILDSFPPDPADHPPVPDLGLLGRARAAAGLARTSLRATPGGQEHWRFFNRSTDLGRRYRGRPWPGRALVVVAQTPEKAQRSRWAPWLTGDWSLVEVAGDHLSMTRLPWSDEVADALAAALGAAALATSGSRDGATPGPLPGRGPAVPAPARARVTAVTRRAVPAVGGRG